LRSEFKFTSELDMHRLRHQVAGAVKVMSIEEH
jgi:hypothetical protein